MKKIKLLLSLFIIHFLLHNVNAQNPQIDSLENLLNQHTQEDTIRVNLLNETALKLYPTNIDKTLIYANEAIKLADKLNYTRGKTEGIRALAIYHWWKSNYPLALDYAQKSLELKIEIEDKKGISSCYIIIGLIYKELGDYSQALEYTQKSLKIKIEIEDKNGITDCYNNIGILHSDQGNEPLALEYYQKSLKISEELGDEQRMSNSLINIGTIHSNQKNYDKALEYYQRSMDIFRKTGDKQGISYCLNNIGSIQFSLGNYSEAKDYYQKSLKIDLEIEDKKGISKSFNNLGNTYLKQEMYSQATLYFKKALKINKEIGYKSGVCYSYEGIGSVYLKTNNYTNALDYFYRSLTIAQELGLLVDQKTLYEQLSRTYSSIGNYKEAYKNFVLFKGLNDRIFNEENIKRITGLEYQFEFDKIKSINELEQQKKDAITAEKSKRQRVISTAFTLGFIMMTVIVIGIFRSFIQKRKANFILVKQKIQIEETNEELTAQKQEIQSFAYELEKANNTKDKFFSIIAHDLKAPFSALLGFSELLLENHTIYDDKERETYIKIINDGSINTYKLLEDILTWAQSQTGRIEFTPEEIDIEAFLNETILILKETAENKEIKLISIPEKDLLVNADRNMIDLILRNLVSNAIKFTPKGGDITLQSDTITDSDNQQFVKISIKDSGVGISPEIQSKLFSITENISTKGTEKEAGTGLGLILCKEFIEKHGGKIWFESEAEKGSEFFFTIPLYS